VSILWIIIIGFVAGIIARLLAPGPNNPTGFILTTVLGIVGAFVATFLGQAVGWYRPDQGARSDRRGRWLSAGAVHLAPAGGQPHHQRSRGERPALAVGRRRPK
jgi:uncharacterized membrane protein YeaQ/YmgE (transglycosylase-associated protein family)